MAARWMQAKLARMKPRNLRFVEAGTVKEARSLDMRPAEMPENKGRDSALIAAYTGPTTRCNTGKRTIKAPLGHTGMMPEKSYGKTVKSHGMAGALWTGGRTAANKIAAAPMKSSLVFYSTKAVLIRDGKVLAE